MKPRAVLFVFLAFLLATSATQAWRKWEFISPDSVEIRLIPENREIIAGEVATFTITIRNRTDKTVHVPFSTGQRWDLAIFSLETQIYRWSQGLEWLEAPHSIPIAPGKTESAMLSWQSLDRVGCPLPQGVYKARGFVMTRPRFLVSNDTRIRLLPNDVKKIEVLKAKLHQHFELPLPRVIDGKEVTWQVAYPFNDNRIDVVKVNKDLKYTYLTFYPKRIGYVIVHLYAHPRFKFVESSIQRRTYRFEIQEFD